jgi:hypothetical protein
LKRGNPGDYPTIIGDDESLKLFIESLAKFDRLFCDHMAEGDDFTLKMEIHGNKSELLHVRVSSDGFKRPDGVEKRVEEKMKK